MIVINLKRWKEECHMITNQSESKFNEMKKNFENLRQHNEKLIADLHLLKQKEIEVIFCVNFIKR